MKLHLVDMTNLRTCALKCARSGREIVLEQCEETTIGRGPKTEITDPKLSKCQVSLVADVIRCSVFIRCLGSNSSGINNKVLKKNETTTLRHGDQLELLLGKYMYKVVFMPPPEDKKRTDICNSNQSTESNVLIKRSVDNNEHISFEAPLKKQKIVNASESKWETVDNGKLLVFTKEGHQCSSKIAAYDLDGTIILTKSGKVFPQYRDDWNLANSAVRPTLSKLFSDGYKVIVFTNQAGISKGKTSETDFKYKVEKIIDALGIPIQVFVATSDDIYRKPAPGMWDVLIQEKNSGVTVDFENSFYVGDAAGREQNWMPKKKKDFSCADRLFALNIGLKFQTPEAHFLKQSEGRYKLPLFSPSKLDCNAPISDSNIMSNTREVILMVGSPGSGKSFFVATHLLPAGYIHVSRDKIGTWQRCVTSMKNALTQNKSVVIDNTNPDRESRRRFIEVAVKMNIPCRCFVLNSTVEHAIHNNKFRKLISDEHVEVNEMMIHSYKKKYEPPMKEEGFNDIVIINFVPKFTDSKRERLYKMYLV